MRAIALLALLSVVVSITGGCAGPVVPILHNLPAAVPLPAGVGRMQAGSFTVTGAPAGVTGADLTRPLAAALATDWPGKGLGPSVGGAIRVSVKDAAAKRALRRYSPSAKAFRTVEVDSLVRTVEVRVDFVITPAGGGGDPLVTVEVRRRYNSLADPRVRGDDALERPDDAARVPPAETVIRELLVEASESFAGMVRPMSVAVEVKMRSAGGDDSAAGFTAAKAGEYPTALKHFRAAAVAAPKNMSVTFNRAVAAEAGGEFDEALKSYEAVVAADKNDKIAAACARRVRRVIAHTRPRVK